MIVSFKTVVLLLITCQFLPKFIKSQQYIKGGSITGFGKGSDVFNSVLTITNAIISLEERRLTKGRCCYSDDGGYCEDDSVHNTPHTFGHVIGYAKGNCVVNQGVCNAFGCECDTRCKENTNTRSGITIYLKDSVRGKYDKLRGIYVRLKATQDCLNLNDFNFNDEARAVMPLGDWIRIWEHTNCGGEYQDLKYGIYRLLREVLTSDGSKSFDYLVSSLGRCGGESNMITLTGHGTACLSPCSQYGEKYYWCDASFSDFGVRRWDYCSPNINVSSNGHLCQDGCDNHGGTVYTWCHVSGGSWDYCSRILNREDDNKKKFGVLKRNSSIQCLTPCRYHDKTYLWCYHDLDGNWDYCK